MADKFKWFENVLTGKIAKFPARFADRPLLREVPSEDASCVDCALPEHETEFVDVDLPDYSIEHPYNDGEDA